MERWQEPIPHGITAVDLMVDGASLRFSGLRDRLTPIDL